MTTYKVIIEKMGEHITDKSSANREFSDFNKAASYLKELCNDNNIDTPEEILPFTEDFGGRGHDYRVSLEVTE